MKQFTFYLSLAALILLLGCNQKDSGSLTLQTVVFSNPVLHLDYSDPDVIQVGSKYYMTASSFNCIPGLPLLVSDNLVDWELIGYAIDKLEPDSAFSKPQHGNGVWAPSIRYRNNQFYIYYGDPDYGIFMVTAKTFKGPWSEPHLVKAGKGWIDPCPFWDEDGTAWLVHAWAGSRAGIKSTLTLHKMAPDGKKLLDRGIIVFDGHTDNPTVEGPKMYKRNGFYYILAPAGGVTYGWQLALRSKNITGPYEAKKVLHQGSTQINGPHQGGLVDAPDGSSWFIHFQDKEAFGRVVHLQPVNWIDDWPVMGNDADGDGLGEPILKGEINTLPVKTANTENPYSDEFNTASYNVHWQWHANPSEKWGAPSGYLGFMRLNAVPFPELSNLWEAPNLFMQKFPDSAFTVTTKMDIFLKENTDRAGLLLMGYDYAYIGIEKQNNRNTLVYRVCKDADKGGVEKTLMSLPCESPTVYVKVAVDSRGRCRFSYAAEDEDFTALPDSFQAAPGKWIGAKIGLFCLSKAVTNDAGYINVDWFKVNLDNND
ncbi:MAG: glycoside hydrolase 43 family protein [Bacteroidota bacterium]